MYTVWFLCASLQLLIILVNKYIPIHWRIQGGAAGARPPQQDQILSFSHTFLPKSVQIGGWHPPNGLAPPQEEILDLPLQSICQASNLLSIKAEFHVELAEICVQLILSSGTTRITSTWDQADVVYCILAVQGT